MRIEIRNDSVVLDGYVNAVARDSRPMLDENGEKFVEQISPKTFQRALEKNDDVLCLLNHDPSRVLGSTKQGNIELFEDNIGLRAICKITDSEVIEKARNGKLRGWSFGFEALKEHEESLENGLKRRFVDEMALDEVSGKYDYCIIDNPPDLGMNVINAMAASDEIIIPVKLDSYSLDGLIELTDQVNQIKMLNQKAVIAGILIVDHEKSDTSDAAEIWLRTASGCPVFEHKIRHSRKVKDSTFYQQTPIQYSVRSGAAQDYKAFADEYIRKFGKERG